MAATKDRQPAMWSRASVGQWTVLPTAGGLTSSCAAHFSFEGLFEMRCVPSRRRGGSTITIIGGGFVNASASTRAVDLPGPHRALALGVLGVGAALRVGLRPPPPRRSAGGGGWHRRRPWGLSKGHFVLTCSSWGGPPLLGFSVRVFVRLLYGCWTVVVWLLDGCCIGLLGGCCIGFEWI